MLMHSPKLLSKLPAIALISNRVLRLFAFGRDNLIWRGFVAQRVECNPQHVGQLALQRDA